MTNDQPLVSIDVIPLRLARGEGIQFATGARIFEPYLGEQALPGVLLRAGESIDDAVKRALKSKVGLTKPLTTMHVGAFDSTNRDPRGATISIALAAIFPSASESSKARWNALHESVLKELPFDHGNIVREAHERVTEALWSNEELTRALLGERFSTSDALLAASPTPHEGNASRWLNSWGPLTKLNEAERKAGAGRPSTLWEWK